MGKDPDPYLKKVLIYGTLYGTYKNMFIEGGRGKNTANLSTAAESVGRAAPVFRVGIALGVSTLF